MDVSDERVGRAATSCFWRLVRSALVAVFFGLIFAGPASAESESGEAEYNRGGELFGEGDIAGAIEAFRRAADAGYRPGGSTYNMACGYAMLGDTTQAVAAIDSAIDAGFTNVELLLDDPDLDPVRESLAFQELIERLRAEHPILLQQITQNRTSDPERAAFIYEDMLNFVRARKMLSANGDTLAVLRAEYFDRATPGLVLFIAKYDLTPERLARALRRHPDAYAAIEAMAEWLPEKENEIRRAFTGLQGFIPEASFPPTYFLVGAHRGIGSGSLEGQLITVEKAASNRDKDFRPLLVHEVVHFQQFLAVGYEEYRKVFRRQRTLLGLTLREGAAEFFTDLVLGRYSQEKARVYVVEHEAELLPRFRAEMHGSETGDWMWRTPSDPEQPQHIAYVIGARMARSYYEGAEDKAQAVREILSPGDPSAFFARSGYAGE